MTVPLCCDRGQEISLVAASGYTRRHSLKGNAIFDHISGPERIKLTRDSRKGKTVNRSHKKRSAASRRSPSHGKMENNIIAEQAMEEGKQVRAKEELSPAPTKKTLSAKCLVAGLVVVIVAAALTIGLGLGLSNRNNNNTKNNSNIQSFSQSGSNATQPVAKVRISDTTTRSLALISGKSQKSTYLDCNDLRVDVRKLALLVANKTIQSNLKDSCYFMAGGNCMYPINMLADTNGAMAPAPEGTSSQGGAKSDSVTTTEDSYGTNNQVEGVEEPDSVQSDGKNIFLAYGTEIIKVSVESQKIVSRTKIPKDEGEGVCETQNIQSMLLVDDRLVVFSSGWCYEKRRKTLSIIGPIFGNEITKFTIYDTDNLTIIGDLKELPGSYINARAIDDNVYVVSSRSLNVYGYTSQFDPWTLTTEEMFSNNQTLSKSEYEARALKVAEESVDEFVTQFVKGLQCESLQQITLFQNTDELLPYAQVVESIATVTAFNVKNPTATSITSRVMPTSYWNMYASASTLVLAAEGYWIGDDVKQETFVLAYELADAKATPLGVGKVPGALINQFAMDEYNGSLRFATTIQQRWRWIQDGDTWESEPLSDSDNLIVVLQLPSSSNSESDLKEVGRLDGLGKPGDTIYSVRFMGDRVFVVTFEQVDPFYTISLKDPTKPVQVGELEIPGYSSYLHPIGEDLVLGVGQNVVDGQPVGLQISLFDVSDLANPTRIANFVETGGDGSSSDAMYSHQAFRLLENGLLILPVQVYDWSGWSSDNTNRTAKSDGETFDGFKVYHVNTDAKTITEYFEISHGSNFYDGCWGYNYVSPRSMVFGGDVWTLKTHTILVHDLTNRVQVGDAAINLDADLTKDECTPCYFGPCPFMVDDTAVSTEGGNVAVVSPSS